MNYATAIFGYFTILLTAQTATCAPKYVPASHASAKAVATFIEDNPLNFECVDGQGRKITDDGNQYYLETMYGFMDDAQRVIVSRTKTGANYIFYSDSTIGVGDDSETQEEITSVTTDRNEKSVLGFVVQARDALFSKVNEGTFSNPRWVETQYIIPSSRRTFYTCNLVTAKSGHRSKFVSTNRSPPER